ncbi:TolC family protein [Rugamonas sp.]|uniref:TolC family protein n=1 Tax=Rugamonas sp. TaxID=1926287 RepID=UPI0025D3552E|nr:TolC family protein [Rugamonas sp.]
MSSPIVFPVQGQGLRLSLSLSRLMLALVVTAMAAATCAAPAFGDTPELTLPQAQQLAVQRSRQLAGSDHAADAARQMAVAAGQLPDPVLKAGIDNLPVSGADRLSVGQDFMTMRRLGVSQELTTAGKRRLRAEIYELEADKAMAAKASAAAAIERDTALAWLDSYFTRRMAAVIADQITQARNEIEAAEGAYRAGRAGQADVFAARAALIAVEDRADEIGQRGRRAAAMLARWTGGAGVAALAAVPPIDSISLDPAMADSALDHHPDIAVLARQEAIAQAEARLADANRTPDWSVELAFQQRGPAYSNMVSIGVSVPLQWDRKNRQDRELSAKLSMAQQATAEREEMLRAHAAEIRSWIIEWQGDRARHARDEQQLLPLLHERTAATLAAYRGGKAALSDVLAARRSELDAQLQLLQLQAEVARLWAQLNFLIPTNSGAVHTPDTIDKDAP